MTHPPQLRAGVYGRQSRGKAKSIDEQIGICTADVEEQGWALTEVYQDGSSASRYARKQRDEWKRVLSDLDAGKLDVLVMWESSRGDRNLTTWSGLLDLCRERDVKIRVSTHEHTYDMKRRRDWEALAQEGISSASDSEKISVGVRRGQAGSAVAGRPSHGRAPFGYRRAYDPATGELLGQEPDPDTAPIVREIIQKAAAGVPISAITDDLNQRKVPTLGAAEWYRIRVRDIATNVAYVGKRIYNGKTYEGIWPPLVDEVTFYGAVRVLTAPERTTTRPGRQRHLLSYLATCTECESPLCAVQGRYRCLKSSCITIVQADADQFVTEMILSRLAKPDAYSSLQQAGEDSDREVLEARGEAALLRDRLGQWRRSAAGGTTSPESLAVVETELTAKIREVERRAELAAIPVALRQILEPGADVRTRWADAPLPARRNLIRAMAVIKVGPASKPGSRTFEPWRLANSRWVGDSLSWADHWKTT